MAIKHFTGGAKTVNQVVTITVGGTLAGEDFIISVNGVTIASFTDTSHIIADTRDALVAAWEAARTAGNPYALYITAEAGGAGELTLTAGSQMLGAPWAVTLNTPGGSATFTQSTTTTASSPNDLSLAANWSGGALPTDGDDIYLDGAIDLLWNLDALAAITPNSVYIPPSAYAIGLDERTYGGLAGAPEYRAPYLKLKGVTTVVRIGEYPSGSTAPTGSGRIKLDLLTTAAAIEVFHSASAATDGADLQPVMIKANNASNSIKVMGGGVSLNADGSTGNFAGGVYVRSGGKLRVGPNVTLPNTTYVTDGDFYTLSGGTNYVINGDSAVAEVARGDFLNLTQKGGVFRKTSAGTWGAAAISNGVCYWHRGNATSITVTGSGHCDATVSTETRTVTDVYLGQNGAISLDSVHVTVTNYHVNAGKLKVSCEDLLAA